MKKVLVYCLLPILLLSLNASGAWAQIDVGWMQQGVRVWYFGAAGSANAEEAYLLNAVDGTNANVTHHAGAGYWTSQEPADTGTYAILETNGPFWIHPQTLQTVKKDDFWQGQRITYVQQQPFTYNTFLSEFPSVPYLLLPIKTLFDLRSQRNIVKIVYQIAYSSQGTAYFDAETGLLLFRTNTTGFVTVFFMLSEINYDFANHRAFAEDKGPHTGFKSIITKANYSTRNVIQMQSMVESRYGATVQMWVTTYAGGSITFYMPPDENYCFFGSVPVLRHKLMTATPNYPPENWNEYGDYLWWWVPQRALQSSSINIFDVPMTRTSTVPYTFEAAGQGTGLYFPKTVFDNDGYVTDFTVKYAAIGLDIGLGSDSPGVPIHSVSGLEYYKNTMGTAIPPSARPNLTPYDPQGWSDKIVVSKVAGTNTDSGPLATTDTLYVDWAVINGGGGATSNTFYTSLYVDGALNNTWHTNPPLEPTFYVYVADYSIGPLSAGTHTIKIVTDTTGAIAEANETDNEYTKTITVLSGSGVRRWHPGSQDPITEPTIAAAFADALDGDAIDAWGGLFDDSAIAFSPAGPTALEFRGGWDYAFGSQTLMTTFHGLTVGGGASLTIENLILQ